MQEFLEYGIDLEHVKQALFASVFVVQNKIQTYGEKVQTEVTMRQWHLIAMSAACKKPKTLTNVAKLMGCSRQNVKNLAKTLETKGFVRLINGEKNAVLIEVTERAERYFQQMTKRQNEFMTHLFSKLNDEEIFQLFALQNKILDGLTRVEAYVDQFSRDHKQDTYPKF